MKPLANTVAAMEPIVAGYVVTRWKDRRGVRWATIITALGWVVSLFAVTDGAEDVPCGRRRRDL